MASITITPREKMFGYYSAMIYYVGPSKNVEGKYIAKIDSRYNSEFYIRVTKEEIQTFCGTQQKLNTFLSKGIGVDLAHNKIKCHVTAQEMMGRLSGLDLQIGQYHKRS